MIAAQSNLSLERITRYFTHEVHHARSLRLFSILVYIWFLIQVIMVWPERNYLWGPDKIFYRHGFPSTVIENFIYQVVYFSDRFYVVFALHIACAVLSLFEWNGNSSSQTTKGLMAVWPHSLRVGVRLITWITGLMLYYSAIEAFNSGMLLMLLMAFYCSIVNTKATTPYGIALTNVAQIACITQVVLVYFLSGVFKLSGEQWLAGDAIYYTMHIDHFTTPLAKDVIGSTPWFYKLLNYAALAYQLLFPLLIWLKKGRWIIIAIGVLFHLFIGFVMHLWDFSLAMVFCYALFIEKKPVSVRRD